MYVIIPLTYAEYVRLLDQTGSREICNSRVQFATEIREIKYHVKIFSHNKYDYSLNKFVIIFKHIYEYYYKPESIWYSHAQGSYFRPCIIPTLMRQC